VINLLKEGSTMLPSLFLKMYKKEYKTGTLISPTPACPKCGSFMFFPTTIKSWRCERCKNCGFIKYQDSLFKRIVQKIKRSFKSSEVSDGKKRIEKRRNIP
jgi:ribosomal protein S27AE